MRVDNAIIMAAGTSSRFAPLSFEKPKALIEVKGEILIERQIKQLKEAGIKEIHIITGYKSEQLEYLRDKFAVNLIKNPEFETRNNNGSVYAARAVLKNSYLCSADDYFVSNPFETEVDEAYYAAVYAEGNTDEWCITEDNQGYISSVQVGGEKAWYMLGHTFWSEDFSKRFLSILEKEYCCPDTVGKLWESIFLANTDKLKMKVRKYPPDVIYEFDSLDELRLFDQSYISNTRSRIIKSITRTLSAQEAEIRSIKPLNKDGLSAIGFSFECKHHHYLYNYQAESIEELL